MTLRMEDMSPASWIEAGYSAAAVKTMLSWRPGTVAQYDGALVKWKRFCSERGLDPKDSSVVQIVNFLAELKNMGQSQSTLNTARSALSNYLRPTAGCPVGEAWEVTRFMRGHFHLNPPKAKYTKMWGVNLLSPTI